MSITILLIENPLLHDSAALITSSADLSLLGHVPTLDDALVICQHAHPDLILLKLRNMGEIPQIRQLRLHCHNISIVIFSRHADPHFIQAVLAAGAMGFLLGETLPSDIATSLKTAHQGQVILSGEIIPLLIRRD